MQGPARRTVYVTGDAEMDAALHEDSAQAGDLIIPTAFDHPAVDAVLVFPHAEVAGPVADEDPSNNKPPHQQPQQYSDHHSQHKPRLHYLLVHNTQAHGGDILQYEGPANQRLRDLIAACGGVERCAVAFFLPPREFATFPLQFIPSTDVAQLRMTL